MTKPAKPPRFLYAIILDQISTCLWFRNGAGPEITRLIRCGNNYYGYTEGLIIVSAKNLLIGRCRDTKRQPPMCFFVATRKELLLAWMTGFIKWGSPPPRSWFLFQLFRRKLKFREEELESAFKLGQRFAKEFYPKPENFDGFGFIGLAKDISDFQSAK